MATPRDASPSRSSGPEEVWKRPQRDSELFSWADGWACSQRFSTDFYNSREATRRDTSHGLGHYLPLSRTCVRMRPQAACLVWNSLDQELMVDSHGSLHHHLPSTASPRDVSEVSQKHQQMIPSLSLRRSHLRPTGDDEGRRTERNQNLFAAEPSSSFDFHSE